MFFILFGNVFNDLKVVDKLNQKIVLWFDTTTNKIISFQRHYLFRFGTKLYRQIVGIPMGTNCVPLVADLFLFCYERFYDVSFCG